MQTCFSKLEILEVLRCIDDHLQPTNHGIHSITKDQLHIKCILLGRIRVGLRERKQVIYVSENTSGFYSLDSLLKDLDLIHNYFPNQTSKINTSAITKGKVLCRCFQRMMIPDELVNILFSPVESKKNCLE